MNLMVLYIATMGIWAPVENTKINNPEKLTGTVYHCFQPVSFNQYQRMFLLPLAQRLPA